MDRAYLQLAECSSEQAASRRCETLAAACPHSALKAAAPSLQTAPLARSNAAIQLFSAAAAGFRQVVPGVRMAAWTFLPR